MNVIPGENFYLFTGGPGAGKTTVLNALQGQGHLVVAEVARDIIKNQRITGGNATHDGDRIAYCDLMLKKSIEDYTRMLLITNKIYSQQLGFRRGGSERAEGVYTEYNTSGARAVFFDRGIPDLFSYSRRFCGGVTSQIIEAVRNYRYNKKAFLFPPWPEIFCHDTERKMDLNEAIETYHAVKEGYLQCGYEIIEIPKISIIKRAKYILKMIEEPPNY